MKDYYQILELSQNASILDIKKAFRRLSLVHHPDISISPTAQEDFIKIYQAYYILKDPFKRKKYDSLLNNTKASTNFQRYESGVQKSKERGTQRATRHAKQDGQTFASQTKTKSRFVLFDVFFEIITDIILAIFQH
jgi:DnaJ-class molecular chaperone